MSRSYISKALREQVTAEARRRCGYCLTASDIVGTPMEIEHIIPEVLGGQTDPDNLWLACSLCNEHKSSRIVGVDPESGDQARLFDPRHQVWAEHFAWTLQGDQILGLTPTGRATVTTLHLNRIHLVRSRRRWTTVGWHPPED